MLLLQKKNNFKEIKKSLHENFFIFPSIICH